MHLLPANTAKLDDSLIAEDLGHTPADMVVLSFSDADLAALANAWRNCDEQLPQLRLANLRRLRHPMSVDLYVETVLTHARLIIVRCLGGVDYWRYGLERVAEIARRKGIAFVVLPGDNRADPRLVSYATAPAAAISLFDAYFSAGGPGNLAQALRLAANLLGSKLSLKPPQHLGALAGLTRDGETVRQEDLGQDQASGAIALIVFYRSSLLAGDVAPILALMKALAGQDLTPLAVAVTSLKDPEVAADLTRLIARRPPSIILNTTAFSALRDDETTVLDESGAPVLQVMLSGSTREAWQTSPRGLLAADLAMNVVLPELDGRVFTRAISFKSETRLDAGLEHASVVHEPAIDRVDFVARLAAAWVRLGAKPRADRRIAIVLSDYPARGGRGGYAVGLDTAQSVGDILEVLGDANYDVGSGVSSVPDILPALERGEGTLKVALDDYLYFFAKLPESARRGITDAWGRPEDDPNFMHGHFVLPCLRAGKVTIALQPDRGARMERKAGYHDTLCPPRHGYMAFYASLRESERIDAMIHLGTHGTLEWLPGKALALTSECFPELVLGPTPLIYPFIVNNPGEAMQAKRRACAVTIGHMTPPLREAGLHGPMATLEGLIEEYADAEVSDRRRADLLEDEIVDVARRSGLADDCGAELGGAARETIARLDAQLCDIKLLLIRDHLHIFGRTPAPDCQAELVNALLKADPTRGIDASLIAERISACGPAEMAALLAALDGRRIAPGPSGAPTRGRFDVLPTGRNLTTIDPRALPTRTAAGLGARAANEVIDRFVQDNGEYPRAVMIDLWASAALRTGGEDLAQALAYMGVRPTWDYSSNRVTGIEAIAIPKLDRPRVDVTLRISGLFRDVFATQIELFATAVKVIAALDEDDEWNPLAAARRRGDGLERIFGGAPGVYGAGAAQAVLDGAVFSRDEVGAAYLDNTSHCYDAGEAGVRTTSQFRARVAASNALIHPQDDRERDLLDGDGVMDFVGGFAAAAAMLGKQPILYHLDTSLPEAPRVRTIREEIVRIVRGRLTNPQWRAGMLAHGHRGVAEIAQSVDALYAFAIATNEVPSRLFDAVHDALLRDESTADALLAANRAAAEAIAARLAEALRLGLWLPQRNAVHNELERVSAVGADRTLRCEVSL